VTRICHKGILGNWTSGLDVRHFLADIRSCLLVRTYALVFSVDVCKGTTRHTLTDSSLYTVNNIADVRSKVSDVCYFLEYSSVNT
jgi:hypothetical protein